MSSPGLFLDRDGVIDVDHGYVHQQEKFDFVDGIFVLARVARGRGYKLIVITNQAGIGRGYYTEADFHSLTVWMRERFAEEGAPIDGVYFSPYHPTAGIGDYRRDDASRKPKPGMLLLASREFDIDLERSVLIGDSLTDIEAGKAAGVRTNLLLDVDNRVGSPPAGGQRIERLAEAERFLLESGIQ